MSNTNTFKPVRVKHLTIGEGKPKICVSLTGHTTEQIIEEAHTLKLADIDMVEWRVDFFEQVEQLDQVTYTLERIRDILPSTPLIFTFRSAKEGGQCELSSNYYVELNQAIAATGEVDLIDVELFNEETAIQQLITTAHEHNTFVIISNHDFQQTPPKEELISRLSRAQQLGADITKIAVMPQISSDVITLLDATNTMKEQHADRPMITMSMAGKGMISRLTGELFGSAITFGAIQKSSAPGQVPVSDLRSILSLLHANL
ncbi:type I 3-dehydroquinate dehydratase [Paenibacillus sp. CFBP13512]|uniref:type I 3-dehydroquinate dehydratase n=1 Tax=Paenibacillus sp. CFBP13512 TaxID=2184007 RepID=UPI0010C077A0|nr:type I 3-dehydroquinate dehydratase [Paenibacillus sp. CFBP13512]TKJ93568.1 type I 3-dehydroquinate dehydratase [Paenibacillus sp. CFBP13512]